MKTRFSYDGVGYIRRMFQMFRMFPEKANQSKKILRKAKYTAVQNIISKYED